MDYYICQNERTVSKVISKTITNIGDNLKAEFEPAKFFKDTYAFEKSGSDYIKKLGNIGTAIGYVTVGADVVSGIYKNYENGEKKPTKYAADIVTDTAFGLGSLAAVSAGAKIGAAIGTAIPIPVVGTVVGAVAGAAIGYGAGKLYDKYIATDKNKQVASRVTEKIMDYTVKAEHEHLKKEYQGAKYVYNSISNGLSQLTGNLTACGKAVAAWG